MRIKTGKVFSPCGQCDNGWLDFLPENVGWTRKPEWDTGITRGYLTPGGVRYDFPREDSPFLVSTVCNCARPWLRMPRHPIAEPQRAAKVA